MSRKIDRWTTALMALAVVATLLACKKRTSETAPTADTAAALPPSAPLTPSPAPTELASAAPTAPDASEPKLGEVKRYPDKEKPQTGAVRILADDVKVYNEADDKTADVATLTRNLLVFRLASVPDYELVEFPSGVGKVSPGWVLAKFVDAKADAQVERGAVAAQTAKAVVTTPPKSGASTPTTSKPSTVKVSPEKAAADKAAAEKAAAEKAAADKAAAEKAAADQAAAEKAAKRAEALAKRAAERAKRAAAAATGGTTSK
jgi:hypothetical protein